MDLKKYQTTHLEDFVDNLYSRINIFRPEQLTIKDIAAALNIKIAYSSISFSSMRNGVLTVHINDQASEEEQWKQFLHELCHVKRHAGNQLKLHPLMRKWQEWDAENFVLYASIPFLMLRRISLPQDQHAAIELITNTFRVSAEMAYTRYHQIARRVYYSIWGGYTNGVLSKTGRYVGVPN
ncbi:hypothetical protein PM3016_1433 [Paenibacillus mucilaginosus 3016]|uniref:IrrE N-terminal-like domain-containing protein n=1 Tax=Paenibacillus mucilaginosus 3016 TaxID=1116391 RepID=H6NEQ4_9BACL|nr:ImmA/IrrE family metallo-endopeptidase [Paenibacillus mucilaginosus]AFC28358.1 hypothetical protein PM3016_1433 [Paenibacillus mucilaginosus 3016]WFA17159.1 ImmA/IrrE family metallo-endopeptidase [Paenibacillus mucilaginosus]